jgi:methionine-rich copper-binding protein CopC
MRMHHLALLAAVPAVTLAVTAGAALAHTEVKSTSPAKGGTAKTSIRTVAVTFNGPIRSGTLRVTGPGGSVVSVGSGGRDPRKITRLRVPLGGGKRAGRYRARWTIVAADGHDQRGSFTFRLRK